MNKKLEINDVVELLAVSAYVAWVNTIGSSTPAQRHYFERMMSPVLGDLILEITTRGRARAIDRIGRLISVTQEPYDYPDWDVSEDGPIPTRDVWIIETLDNRKFHWENCDFIVIPEDAFNHPGRI